MAVGFSGSKACLTSDSETFANFFLSRNTNIVRFLWPKLDELKLARPGGKFNCKKTPHLVPTSEAIRLMISKATILSSRSNRVSYSDCRSSRFFQRSLMIQLNHPQPFPAIYASKRQESLSSAQRIRTQFRQLVSSAQSARADTRRRVES